MSPEPVFFDPHGKRRRRVSIWAAALGALLAVATTAFIVSLFVVPLLPKIKGLNDSVRHPAHLIPRLPDAEKRKSLFLATKARQELNEEIAKDKQRREGQKAPAGSPVVAAFYAPYQEVGITSFRENAKHLTHVMPVWLRLSSNGLIDASEFTSPTNSKNGEFIELARRNGVRIWPVLRNGKEDSFDAAGLRALLDSPAQQTEVANHLRDWLVRNRFDGLNIDFESLSSKDLARLPSFYKVLRDTLHPAGLGLSVDLESGLDASTASALAKHVDLAIVMAYDEHSETDSPGPIASVGWIEKRLEQFTEAVPANKLVIGIGSYAYDWPSGKKAAASTYQEALKAAEGYRDEEPASDVIELDQTSLNTHFSYEDDGKATHQVWLLDGVSAFNQWKLARDAGVRGSALWMLGTEDPSVWRFLNRDSGNEEPDAKGLLTVQFGPDELEFVGQGDLLYAKGEPKTAARDIEVDKQTGLVVGQTYRGYPSSYYLEKAGYAGRQTIALTFDDGPDPAYTGSVLDVLKENGVPATFFVIGQNAEANPDLVRRIFEEGHEIGSHTFSHPNLDETSDRRTELELNATQRIIQGITGRTTALFRPPFNADSEPTKPEDIRPILLSSKLGYVTVGESVDPQDWRLGKNPDGTGARRTPEEIVSAVLYQLSFKDHGNILLLHDGGGDRSATVKALRLLIPQLQAKGYKFVPVSSLLGSSRDAVMPPIGGKDRALIGFDKVAFGTIFTFEWLLRLAFLIAIGLGLLRVVSLTVLAIVHHRRKVVFNPSFRPSVSVLVAAFNEEKVIGRTVRSILESKYPVTEVIVVDDGSTDETFLDVVTAFAGDHRVVVLRQENGGKAAALNHALAQARGEVVVCIDADTQLKPDAIGLLVPHFENKQVGAVAGNVKVGNRLNLLTRWQSIEYVTSQNLDRKGYAVLDAISVCPGAIGAWRKTAIVEAGGYASDTLAEDMDLTWRLQRAGWTVATESGAIAYTEAPDTLRSFYRQRFRWAYGTLQCLWKHRKALGKSGWFGWITLPTLWLFQVVFQVIAPLVDLQLFYTAAMFLVAWVSSSQYSQDWRPVGEVQQSLVQIGFLYGLFFTAELVSGLIAYRMDKERAGSLWWLFLQRFVYRQIMYFVVYRSVVTAIRGRRQGWGKLERKATVEIESQEVREKASVK